MIWTSHPPKAESKHRHKKSKQQEANQDQAATIERPIDVPLIVDRTYTYEKEFLQKDEPKRQPIKPIAIALVAAIFVGSVLGAGVLKILGLF